MNRGVATIRLSRSEVDYLTHAGFLSADQIRIIADGQTSQGQGSTFVLSADDAELFRDMFTEQLAKVGFDENYAITTEGDLLEKLIDRFVVA